MRPISVSGDRFGRIRLAAALVLALGCVAAAPPDTYIGTPVDPMTIADDDFARNRDPAIWDGLGVERIIFTEGETTWRLWRIVNTARPSGPLWAVTHDNENATFAAALAGLRAWGGVAMIVDTGPADSYYDARFNRETSGQPIDPNRHFSDALPLYARTMLADAVAERRLIIALHTNAADFDPTLSDCPAARPGRGAISVGLCNDRYRPRASRAKHWPYDDEDSLVLVPYRDGSDRMTATCAGRLMASDMNLVFEHVAISDGSLSNYAVQHGLSYINIETEERGSSPAGIALARNRLVNMVDAVMERCGPVSGVAIRPPARR